MPGAGSRLHAPRGSAVVLARRRAVAVVAVAVCIVSDVIGVAAAANRVGVPAGRDNAAGSATSVTAPAARVAPVGSAGAGSATAAGDGAETVPAPDAGTPVPSTSPAPGASKVVQRGSDTFTVLPVPAGEVKQTPSTGREVTYTVEMEGGLGVDETEYVSAVVANLTDGRGWQKLDHVRFVNVTPTQAAAGTQPDLRITLASPDTTDQLCAPLETHGQVSCHNGKRVVLNARRWLLGADAYGNDLSDYRIYLVNHEVGHGIGHAHVHCAGEGKPAAVMMQQTYGLDGCTAWPWPTPPA